MCGTKTSIAVRDNDFANLANFSYWAQSYVVLYSVQCIVSCNATTPIIVVVTIPPQRRYCVLTSHRLQIMTQASICPPLQSPKQICLKSSSPPCPGRGEKISFWGKLCVDYEFGKYRRPIKQSGEGSLVSWIRNATPPVKEGKPTLRIKTIYFKLKACNNTERVKYKSLCKWNTKL